ncbi:MAG: HEPN domain-containing protein [Sedimentisphaerales bacterium]|nr:HEPN domain-containing protein [Sedimentisphaerales bacterium]
MTGNEKQKELARYRIQQAAESLDEARFLLAGGKSARSVINRAYYAMFYAVLALLVYEEFSSSKHSGVLSYFNHHFIKAGVFDRTLGLALARAFELRQRVDYRERVELSQEDARQTVERAERFVETVTAHLAAVGKM